MKKKKILYLATQSELGGSQKYIYDLALRLDKNKFAVEVAVGGKAEPQKWLQDLEARDIKIHHLSRVIRKINLWFDFLSIFSIYVLLCQVKPDIVHLNSSKIGATGGVVAWFYKKCHNKKLKIIYTAHGFVFAEPLSWWRHKFYLWSEKISGLCKDAIICVSENDKNIALNNRVANNKKFITIHNGIDLKTINFWNKEEAQEKLQAKFNLPNRDYWVGTIANLYTNKGLIYLIRAAKLLLQENPKIIFVVFGEGELRPELEKEIEKLELKNDFFLVGAQDDAAQYLKAFDVFVLASVKEGFPYSILEAMAAGLPLVTSQVGGVVEVVENEKNGLVVTPKKPRELVKAVERILNSYELQEKFGKNNLEKVKNYSLEKVVNEVIKIYDN